jgi:hypothetical protein
MHCPKCGKEKPVSSVFCQCGYDFRQAEVPVGGSETSNNATPATHQGADSIASRKVPKAYYFPWSLLVILLVFVISTSSYEIRSLYFVARAMLPLYVWGFLLPVLVYKPIGNRKWAYGVHCLWFVALWMFSTFNHPSGMADGKYVAAYGIWTVKNGLVWDSSFGNDVLTFVYAGLFCAALYSTEKIVKETWRHRHPDLFLRKGKKAS